MLSSSRILVPCNRRRNERNNQSPRVSASKCCRERKGVSYGRGSWVVGTKSWVPSRGSLLIIINDY